MNSNLKLKEYDLEDYLIQRIIEKQITYRAWADIKLVLKGIFKFAKRHQYTKIAIDDVINYVDSATIIGIINQPTKRQRKFKLLWGVIRLKSGTCGTLYGTYVFEV